MSSGRTRTPTWLTRYRASFSHLLLLASRPQRRIPLKIKTTKRYGKNYQFNRYLLRFAAVYFMTLFRRPRPRSPGLRLHS